MSPPMQSHPECSSTVQLSVIIPCLNLGHLIAYQLEALAAQSYASTWEVIVSDNGSHDNTREVVERYRSRLPGLQYLDASARAGSSYARNLGAQAAAGAYLVFIDADDMIAPGFLTAISEALDRHEFVAPRIETLTLNHSWGSRLGQHPQYHGLMRYYNEPFLDRASGCGMSIRRSVFHRLGGFDETMIRLQDSEFCFRAQRSGVALSFAPEALIHGRNRSSLKEIMRQSLNWGRAEVKLVGLYRARPSFGLTIYLWLRYLARWIKLLILILTFRSIVDVNRWGQEVARQAGIFEAALRLRSAPI